MAARPPMPPFELANRVSALDDERPAELYDLGGQFLKERVLEQLPPDWSFEGKRVLDFGCGAGRVLRWFTEEARRCEFHGCDIDRPSVEWLEQNLSPPFRIFENGEEPPLPFDDCQLDLIYAVSVFTHLADSWSRWLLELHRCLAPGGVLIATLMGGSLSERFAHEPWDPDRVGMNVLAPGQAWDRGGPMVMHSRWWVEAHWGRAFEIAAYREGESSVDHDWLTLTRKEVSLGPAELEAPEPGEERELAAARHNLRQLAREIAEQRVEIKHLRRWTGQMRESRSWKLTRPLRAIKRAFRAGTDS